MLKKIDVVIPMYNFIEYSGAYLKTLGSLLQIYRNEPDLDTNDFIIHFSANNISASFRFKQQITRETGNSGTKEIMFILKF